MRNRVTNSGTERGNDYGEEDLFVMPSTFYCAVHPAYGGKPCHQAVPVPLDDTMDHFVTIRIVCRWQPNLMDEKRGRKSSITLLFSVRGLKHVKALFY